MTGINSLHRCLGTRVGWIRFDPRISCAGLRNRTRTSARKFGVFLALILGIPAQATFAVVSAAPATAQETAELKAAYIAYEKGDHQAAVAAWKRFSRDGNPVAQHNLGISYALGHGVKKDYGNAKRWIEEAADRGFTESHHTLALMYSVTSSPHRNFGTAIDWLTKSKGKGFVRSFYTLGKMYEYGAGVLENHKEAFALIEKAAEKRISSGAVQPWKVLS